MAISTSWLININFLKTEEPTFLINSQPSQLLTQISTFSASKTLELRSSDPTMSDSTTLIPVLNELMEEYTELEKETGQGSYEAAVQVEDKEDENEKQQKKGEESRKEKGELMKPEENR